MKDDTGCGIGCLCLLLCIAGVVALKVNDIQIAKNDIPAKYAEWQTPDKQEFLNACKNLENRAIILYQKDACKLNSSYTPLVAIEGIKLAATYRYMGYKHYASRSGRGNRFIRKFIKEAWLVDQVENYPWIIQKDENGKIKGDYSIPLNLMEAILFVKNNSSNHDKEEALQDLAKILTETMVIHERQGLPLCAMENEWLKNNPTYQAYYNELKETAPKAIPVANQPVCFENGKAQKAEKNK